MKFRKVRHSCQMMLRFLIRYRKRLCVIAILWLMFFYLWSKLLANNDKSAIRSDFHDIPNLDGEGLKFSFDSFGALSRKETWNLEETNDDQGNELHANIDDNVHDLGPISNQVDNLLDTEIDDGQGKQSSQYCMGMAESGREIFDQSRLKKSLLRRRTCHGCFEHRARYVLNGSNICDKKNIFVIFLITSSHQNFLRRTVLRQTWLTFVNKTSNLRYAFILGESPSVRLRRSIESENEKFGDIVKTAFLDIYTNLTLKTMLGFQWAATHCPQAKYVMKTDDDIFVNIPSLVRMLSRPDIQGRAQRSIFGRCYRGFPNRYVLSKYYTSYHTYIRRLYPSFCSGTGYVTSMRVVRKLNTISSNIPFFHLEDVYVGMCMEVLRYSMINVSGFRLKVLPRHYSACVYTGRSAITTHARIPDNIFLMWKLRCDDNRI